MKLPQARSGGLSVLEMLVTIVLVMIGIALVGALVVPNNPCGPDRYRVTKTGSNAAALAKSWIKMMVDYAQAPDVHVGWPGDLARSEGAGKISTAKDFYRRLIEYGDLKHADLPPLITAHGLKSWDGQSLETLDIEKMTPFKIYKVSESDPPETIFITSKNYTYNQELDRKKVPFGDKRFVVVSKQGNFNVYQAKDARSLEKVGLLPGRKDFADRPREVPADYLLMR